MGLYCAFVDFQSVPDSVWRHGLWHNLIKEGINGKAVKVVVKMYNKINDNNNIMILFC